LTKCIAIHEAGVMNMEFMHVCHAGRGALRRIWTTVICNKNALARYN
jgi:hypothetical protein